MRPARTLALLTALASCAVACSSSPAAPTSTAPAEAGQSPDAGLSPHDGAPASDVTDASLDAIPVTQTLTASVLSAPVEVVRDAYGIPHIYGQTLADVGYAEGYVMAEDRLIEMDLGRRLGEGTLSALVGSLDPSILATDIAMRMQNMTATATTTWQDLMASTAPRDQALVQTVQNFAAGINAFVADANAGKATLPPTSQTFYSAQNFTAWTPTDSIVLAYLQAFELVYDSDTEITFTQIQTAATAIFDNSTNPTYAARKGIGKDLEILTPQDPTFNLPGWTGFNGDTSEAKSGRVSKRSAAKGHKTAAPDHALARAPRLTKAVDGALALLERDAKTMRGIGNDRMVYPIRGSNNFILGPSLTADHHVVIGNDTHLALNNPPDFYLVQLVASGGPVPINVMGVNFPGIPGIVLGNNEHIAWAATDNYIDVTDVYQETVVNCADSTPYAGTGSPCVVFNGLNVALVPRLESFQIGTFGNITSTVMQTLYDVPQHGPIIPNLDANNNVLPLTSTELSVKYAGYQPSQLLRALLGVATSSTMQEAVAALDQDFGVGGENWLIGDDQGNFGWTQVCTVPRRAAGYAPWLVLPGTGEAEWGASMDRHYIPHAYNPDAGYITTANNDPIGVTKNNDPFFSQPMVGDSPLYLGFDYDPGTRVGRMTKRIQASIAAGHKFTQADVTSIQGDIVSEWGQAMAPTFISVAADLAAEVATPGVHPQLTAIAMSASPTVRGLVQKAHDIMAAWTDFETLSGEGTETSAQDLADSQAALLDAVFYSNFSHLTFDDEVAALGVTPLDTELRKLLVRMCTDPSSLATEIDPSTGDNILFDNLNTPTVTESKEQVAAQAIVNTLTFLTSAPFTSDPSSWTWGTIHTLTLDYLLPSTALNLPPPTDTMYPTGYPRHGDDGTVDPGAHGLSLTDYTYALGPAIRFGADINPAGITAQNTLPGGETFDPTSPHYQDQLALWLTNQPFPLAESLSAVVASAQAEYAAHKDGRVVFTP
jgi:penicillin G amidase